MPERPPSGVGTEKALTRAIASLKRVVLAARYLQEAGRCCHSLSVIVHENIPGFKTPAKEADPVYLRRIEFRALLSLLQEARVLVDATVQLLPAKWEGAAVLSLQDAALAILEVLGSHNFPLPQHLTLDETWHLVALAAQFASIAFLSYNQGHVAPIHPFYLDIALNRIYLLGTHTMLTAPYWIVLEPTQLSCLGKMFRSPVMTFSMQRPLVHRHDIVACAEDILGEPNCLSQTPNVLMISAQIPGMVPDW
jgi:hypothetical protein